MTPAIVLEIGRETVFTALAVVAPIMGVGFVIGLTISLVQAIMQIQEMTIAFVPKIVAIGMALIYFGSYMIDKLMDYTKLMLANFSSFIS